MSAIFSPYRPTPQSPILAPSKESIDTQKELERARKKAVEGSKGKAATILTGPSGVMGKPNTASRDLVGVV